VGSPKPRKKKLPDYMTTNPARSPSEELSYSLIWFVNQWYGTAHVATVLTSVTSTRQI